jgi:para-aminobenzoate synthetase/4-amino-4-deoxychorismate lyase
MSPQTAGKSLFPAQSPEEGTVVLRDAQTGRWLAMDAPERVVVARRPDEVLAGLCEIERCVERQGMTAAGFLAYEAAPAFDAALTTCANSDDFPLLWFGLYRRPRFVDLPEPIGPLPELVWRSTVDRAEYDRRLRRIHRYIAAGDTYQVNYSYRLRAPFAGDPWALFTRLAAAHGPEFGGYVHTGRWTLLSLSPELFFRRNGERVESIPMKGTIGRGLTPAEDCVRGRCLRASGKDQAENVMIVDMVRNDLGRIALPGSVRVEELFGLRRYPTLWQMTSTVTGRVRADLGDVFSALFPAASITGAPKARTMAIIRELETSPRRIYTGTIGFVQPDRRAQFNVAIRTLLMDQQSRTMEYGVGGGIVADSATAAEWEETRVKSLVCRRPPPEFSLLETLLWTPEAGYALLSEHLRRLAASADYFARCCDVAAIQQQLDGAAAGFQGGRRKVRLLLDRRGGVRIESGPLAAPESDRPVRLALAAQPIDAGNVFLHHKTTHREIYRQARSRAPAWADDVILYNRQGEVTETTIANILFTLDGREYTPPARCGLLPGTMRRQLLDRGEIEERVLPLDLLRRGTTLTLINSVRGRWPAVLATGETDQPTEA